MYFVVQITRSGSETAKALFDFPTIDAAKANYFYFLSSSYSNASLDYFMAAIIDDHGNVLTTEIKGE